MTERSPLLTVQALLKNYFFAIIGAAAVAFFLRVYVVEAFRIPADFMAPTLLAGDHIFVNKLAYGGKFGLKTQEPRRGEVVVFSFPSDPTKDYIKRVIGVGGDNIEIHGGQIRLNGKDISHAMDSDVIEEELDGHKYYAQWKGIPSEMRKMMPVTVPAGQVFVLGDNRPKGQDSRNWGFLPQGYLKGRAEIIWFSRAADEPGLGVRWQRVMTKVR